MTDTREGPTVGEHGPGPNTQLTGGDSDTDGSRPAAYVAGLRRRRAASWRCPPLDCGRRDPWSRDPRPGIWYRRWIAERRAAQREAESWAMAVEHLAGLSHDVAALVPAEVSERWGVAS